MKPIECTVIFGPTAVGKSGFLYENFPDAPLHVISADSMQVYRHFDVATATPSQEDRNKFPHSLINEIDPSEEFSVTQFLNRADEACRTARQENRHPILLGGTALYIRTFLFGMDDMPDKNPAYREKLRKKARETSRGNIHDRLKEIDPQAADKIHPNDLKRVIRALEIHHETGQTKTELTSEDTLRSHLEPTVIGLRRDREELDDRIRARIHRMLENGLVDEIRALRKKWDVSETLQQAIGFQSVSEYLDDKITKDEMFQKIHDRTYQLVRKQETWYKKIPVDRWFHPDQDYEELIATVGNQFD